MSCILFSAHCSAEGNFWVDSSCSSRPMWPAFLQETFDMAKKTSTRLDSDTDTDFLAVVKRIFKVTPDEEDFVIVEGMFGDRNWDRN
jgi:hypothetical protein